MPYRILCNDVQREGAKSSPGLASELFCYMPLHNIWYGIRTTTKKNITPIGSAKTGDTVPWKSCAGCWAAQSRDLVLSRALYATQFTRQIDKHGYVRFKHWKFFGENGLPAGEEVSVWIYENTRDPLSIRRQPSHCIPFVWIKTSRSPRSKMLAAWKHTFAPAA